MKKAMLFLIRLYKQGISPYLPGACKYEPTCSEYAQQAIMRFGVMRGLILALWRIIRCNPFSRGGYDPVPNGFTDAFSGAGKNRSSLSNDDGHDSDRR
ncbi:MAG: membrane protein insertion efficiency factor YidD [Clostridia bacterium]|nr:membrane protein insertion efficiency factor YidD [Clostridia bacterium]